MVSWLFLGVCLVGAALVWNVFRPIRAGARLSAVSFFLGWLTGELALHHVFWQAVATAGFVAFGALAAWPGGLGLGIALASSGRGSSRPSRSARPASSACAASATAAPRR